MTFRNVMQFTTFSHTNHRMTTNLPAPWSLRIAKGDPHPSPCNTSRNKPRDPDGEAAALGSACRTPSFDCNRCSANLVYQTDSDQHAVCPSHKALLPKIRCQSRNETLRVIIFNSPCVSLSRTLAVQRRSGHAFSHFQAMWILDVQQIYAQSRNPSSSISQHQSCRNAIP